MNYIKVIRICVTQIVMIILYRAFSDSSPPKRYAIINLCIKL